MSKTITPSAKWSPLDIDGICKLYDQTKTGTSVRQGNKSAAITALVNAINHLLAHTVRVSFQQGQSFEQRAVDSGAVLHQWRWRDETTNEIDLRYRFLAVTRISTDTNPASASYDAWNMTPLVYGAKASPSQPDDEFFTAFTYERTLTDGLRNGHVNTNADFSIVDVVVHNKPLPALEISLHDMVPSGGPSPGQYVVANILKAVNEAFFELRSKCLPVLFSYHAQGESGGWNTPSTTDKTGIVVTGTTTYVNILDQSVSARTATTPGFIFDCYKCAAGIDGRVPIETSILAAKVDGGSPANASFQVEGPDHVASNTAAETAITGSSATWYDLGDHVYGNAAVDVTDVTTERNKVDAFAKLGHADDTLYIYSVCGNMRWTI